MIRWHKVMDAAHPYPDDGVVVSISLDGKDILITKLYNKFWAYDARCPHEGAPLHKVVPDEDLCVTCPLHRYCFHLQDGKEKSGRKGKLVTYPIEVRNEGLFIGFDTKTGWSLW